ncbi:MAG: ATP-binding protein [Sedimentisphaerales bacterium]|nr:ATP-binding protein [Sedimentisphaerales bacterium]
MKIAIASGKGGTGKTTVATNLAMAFSKQGRQIELLDCDVEEPNCHIFVKPEFESSRPITIPVPLVDNEKCTHCGICTEVCQYSAILCLKGPVMVFEELCHGCGGCMQFCPAKAITEHQKEVGIVETGRAHTFRFLHGKLNIGQVLAPAVIKGVKAAADNSEIILIDAPPGTSCSVIETIRDTDLVVLVTEPTPFGLNDLKLAVDMTRALRLPFAVVINRCDIGDNAVKQYCTAENIKIILEIPDDRRIARTYSRGEIASTCFSEYADMFSDLAERVINQMTSRELFG